MKQKLSIRSWSEEDRPREKLLKKGSSSLTNAELMSILIGSGNRDHSAVDLSKNILESIGNDLDQLARLQVDDLVNFKGIGKAKAVTIVSAFELGRRKVNAKGEKKITSVSSSDDAFRIIEQHLCDLDHEEFWIILLNRANRLIELRNVSKGGVSGTIADAKLIFKAALSKLSSSIILCHNHPSGNIKPSKADIVLTKKLVEGGKNLDIAVLDHLIIGNNSYFSFADEGMI